MLKVCPFCGGEAKVLQSSEVKQVCCSKCGAHNVWSVDAVSRWDKRTTNDTDLKPCPICGGKGNIWETYDGKWVVQCKKCTLTTSLSSTEENAKRIWNKREIKV